MESGRKPLILIVDDVEPIRILIEHALGAAGYDTRYAADGTEGLRLSHEVRPDLVIMDLVREGLGTISALREQFPQMPIIAMPEAIKGDLQDLAKAAGADAALPKPINPKQLRQTVERLLKKAPTA